jgi:hypothetical protein
MTAAGVVAFALLLVLVVAGPASAAPRVGITAVRGLPAEVGHVPSGATFLTHSPSSASPVAPAGASLTYGTMPWATAWVIGAVAAILLLVGSRSWALAQRRSGRLTGLAGRDEESDDQRRRAA